MASPRRRKLKKILRLRRKQQVNIIEQQKEELPKMVDEPVVKEDKVAKKEEKVVEKKKPVAKKVKKAAKKDD
tara:strand:+ start:6282 stop:6497 length:216 start_codon:yes stop_codon:yes gene_type:complete